MPDQFFANVANSPQMRRTLARLANSGEIRRIVPGLYTNNITDPVEKIVTRNAIMIASTLFPGAVLSGRSGIELQPTKNIALFLSDGGIRRTITVGSIQYRFDGKMGPIEGDPPFIGSLYRSSIARSLIENLSPSRARGIEVPRTLGQAEVEKIIEKICLRDGEDRLNEIRDEAKNVAQILGLESEYKRFSDIVGTVLGSRNVKLMSGALKARASGSPYDEDCLDRIILLRKHLSDVALPEHMDTAISPASREALSFIESYFTNYIEGTKFLLEEAKEIVFDGHIPAKRPSDGRDVLETFKQVSAFRRLNPTPMTWSKFRAELLSRHSDLMNSREDKLPGKFKIMPNGAGNTGFVDPRLVEGTLEAAVKLVSDVSSPFSRAVLIHFMLTDIHPFADGNGRISRIMMNKELVGAGHSRIVIPTVHRDDYIDTLRQLSRFGRPDGLVRLLGFCQKVTAATSASNFDETVELWASTYAFQEPHEQRFRMPNQHDPIEWRKGVPAPASHWREVDDLAGGSPPTPFNL